MKRAETVDSASARIINSALVDETTALHLVTVGVEQMQSRMAKLLGDHRSFVRK